MIYSNGQPVPCADFRITTNDCGFYLLARQRCPVSCGTCPSSSHPSPPPFANDRIGGSHRTCPACDCSQPQAADFLFLAAAVVPAFIIGVLYTRILSCMQACGKRMAGGSSTEPPSVQAGLELMAYTAEPVVGTPVLGTALGTARGTALDAVGVRGTPLLTPVATVVDDEREEVLGTALARGVLGTALAQGALPDHAAADAPVGLGTALGQQPSSLDEPPIFTPIDAPVFTPRSTARTATSQAPDTALGVEIEISDAPIFTARSIARSTYPALRRTTPADDRSAMPGRSAVPGSAVPLVGVATGELVHVSRARDAYWPPPVSY